MGTDMADKYMPRLKVRYREQVVPSLMESFKYRNRNEVPHLTKVVLNMGLGEAIQNPKAIEEAVGQLAQISGQKPVVTRARKSISSFKLRTGMSIGAKVTMRGDRMWDFLDRLISLAIPRIRDFKGVPSKSFDGRGNFSMGIREQIIFPEINYDKIDRIRGLNVTISTTARTDEEGRELLSLLGMPFRK
jgi:large subunit ribosomal protein L5